MTEFAQNASIRLESAAPEAAPSLSTRKCLLILFAVVSAVFLPLAFLGIPDGFDLMQHMRFAMSYQQAILSGEIVPKWAGQDNFGFGSIGVRYYPPLAYATTAVIRIMTGDWYTAFWLTAFGWIIVGCVGMYLWIKEWSSHFAALSAAIIYAIIPFHTFEIYQAVLFSEFAAAGLMPFCFLFFTRVCRMRRWSDVVCFAAFYSMLLLTHIPTGLIVTAGMAVYAIAIVEWKYVGDLLLKGVASVALVVSATIFHIAKSVPELDWVQHNSPKFFARGFYDYKSYLFPIFFSAPDTRYVEKMLWHFDWIILITLLFFFVGLATFLASRGSEAAQGLRSRVGVGVLLAGGLSIFMLSVASLGIWNSVTFLQKIQFPWRWLGLASITASALFGLSAPILFFKHGRLRRWIAYPIVGLVFAAVAFDISQNVIPSTPLSRDEFQTKIDKAYNEEACDCWWPIWAKREALEQKELVISEREARSAYVSDVQRTVSVGDGPAAMLRVPLFYHPFWTATVNRAPVEVDKDENGAVMVPVGDRAATVQLTFIEPWYIHPAEYLSLIAWLFILAFTGYVFIYRRQRGTFELR